MMARGNWKESRRNVCREKGGGKKDERGRKEGGKCAQGKKKEREEREKRDRYFERGSVGEEVRRAEGEGKERSEMNRPRQTERRGRIV